MMIAIAMAEAMLMGVPVPFGEQPEARTLTIPRGPVVDFHAVICLLPFIWDKFFENMIFKSCNYTAFLLSDAAILCYL